MTEQIKIEEVAIGLALLSPLDELAVAVVSGGTSTPTAPIQSVVSGALGLYFIAHGARLIK